MTVRQKVLIFDNTDLDNPTGVAGALHPLLNHDEVCAVIVSGRFAHSDRRAPIDECDPLFSRVVRTRNARRMKGTLRAMGYDDPVFEGLIPPRTIVPHRLHIDETKLDLWKYHRRVRCDGDFSDALDYIASTKGPIDLIVGGYLTEVRAFMHDPRIAPRLGVLCCQLGRFNFTKVKLVGGGRRQFNSSCDPGSTKEVLAFYPGPIFMESSDIAKLPEVGVEHPKDFARMKLHPQLLLPYGVYWREVTSNIPGELLFPYDLHPVLAMGQLQDRINPLYQFRPVRITGVNDEGEIDIAPARRGCKPRFVATSVDAPAFWQLFQTLVCE